MSNVPAQLRYAKSHEWLKAASDGTATVGITDYAQNSLGDITFVQVPKVGTALKAGETFGVVESTKAVSDLFAPVSGKVVEVNAPLVDAPETVNEDPYEEGWMIAIEPSDPKELADLLDVKAYTAFVDEQE